MPSRNQVIIQRLYEALDTRNNPALFSLLSPKIQVTHSPGLPWGGTFRGHDGAKIFLERMTAYVTSYVAIERILDAGDHVAVTGRTYGATRRSGRRFDVPFVHLWHLEEGLVVGLQVVLDLPAFQVALADAA
ncbi:MAG TPA: nuclear transport factor 2 family protein [Myxococcaceae bacterium]|nr:nuclear transport factor 2 family protein [Myxococcaceae bacterium]